MQLYLATVLDDAASEQNRSLAIDGPIIHDAFPGILSATAQLKTSLSLVIQIYDGSFNSSVTADAVADQKKKNSLSNAVFR